MDGGARCPDPALELLRRDARKHLPTPGAYLAGRGRRAQAHDRLLEAEFPKRLLGVCREQQPGADLLEALRALEDDDLQPRPSKRYRHRQPTDAAAYHDHLDGNIHILAFPTGLRQRPAWRHLSAIGSSLPSLFVLPSNVTFAFRSVTPGHA